MSTPTWIDTNLARGRQLRAKFGNDGYLLQWLIYWMDDWGQLQVTVSRDSTSFRWAVIVYGLDEGFVDWSEMDTGQSFYRFRFTRKLTRTFQVLTDLGAIMSAAEVRATLPRAW